MRIDRCRPGSLIGASALAATLVVTTVMPTLSSCNTTDDQVGQVDPESQIDDAPSGGAATSIQRATGDADNSEAAPIEFDAGRPFAEVAGSVLGGGVSHHVIDGEAGQVLMVTFAKRPSGLVSLTVRDPHGAILADAVADAVVELPATGRHRISVNGAAETDYTLYVTKSWGSTLTNPERITLETVATIDGTTAAGEIVQYEFLGAAGDQLAVQVASSNGRYVTSARTADGVVWLSFAESAFSGSSEITRTVPVTGSHVVSLLSLGAVDPAADTDYELQLRLNEPE